MLYYLLAIILIVIDQAVKVWVRGNIPLGGSVPFLPHVMELTYVQNTGAAFSFLAGANMTWLLALVSLAATAALTVLIAKRVFKHPLSLFALALILGGAAGNLIDRALFGFVTDMFRTTFINFAVFNVADIGVTVGGALFILCLLFVEKEEPAPVQETPLSEKAEEPPLEDGEDGHDQS